MPNPKALDYDAIFLSAAADAERSYSALSSPSRFVHALTNARRRNSDDPYDFDKLQTSLKDNIEEDMETLDQALEMFFEGQ
jgi:hypothetical protein